MPFCSHCGKQVGNADVFCGRCGARQPNVPAHGRDPLAGVSPRAASILCYIPVLGWIASIVFLASHRFRDNHTVRFHAFQGLYLFVAWLIADQVIGMIPHLHLGDVFRAIILGVWIFMLIKTSHEEVYSLPVIGELAERSISERG